MSDYYTDPETMLQKLARATAATKPPSKKSASKTSESATSVARSSMDF